MELVGCEDEETGRSLRLQSWEVHNDIVLNIIKEVNKRINKTKQQLQNEPKGT